MTDKTYRGLLVEKRASGVAIVTLNRPEILNAIDWPMHAALEELFVDLDNDRAVKAVVLTGAGRGFCSGGDQNALDDDLGPISPTRSGRHLIRNMLELECPLIAAVNGLGVGFGFTVLGYCDHVLLAEGARLRTPFSQLGLCPEASASYTFPLRMGWAEASRALMMGDWFTAAEVVASGLGQQVVAPDALLDTARDLARRYAVCPLQSLRATKALMLKAHLPHIQAARAAENAAMRDLLGTPANTQALADFAARERKPGR